MGGRFGFRWTVMGYTMADAILDRAHRIIPSVAPDLTLDLDARIAVLLDWFGGPSDVILWHL